MQEAKAHINPKFPKASIQINKLYEIMHLSALKT